MVLVLGLQAWVEVAAPAAADTAAVVDIVAEVRVEVEFGKFAEVDLV